MRSLILSLKAKVTYNLAILKESCSEVDISVFICRALQKTSSDRRRAPIGRGEAVFSRPKVIYGLKINHM
jgi:hypothetical protein